ncbi:hypothetical protein [Marinitenerispora sediminis]|uniref:hypothetical protein n=1 Tax=Marinitenerispora sediminis TaxID=1931232 RepID=UPI0015F12DB5|nr:hypothetical protein [Marinitenerispora sediminis]
MVGLLSGVAAGLALVGLLAARLLGEARRLRAQVARTRAELEPRCRVLRELTEDARRDVR